MTPIKWRRQCPWTWGATVLAAVGCAFAAIGCGSPPVDDGGTEPPTTQPAPDDDVPGNDGLTGKFVGSTRCSTCHRNLHGDWSETLHASALETLESIGQDKNPVCLECHTVGYGEAGGFVDRATTDALAGVGCEACHGPARDHAENANDESLIPKIDLSADVCGACHTGSKHPNFDEWLTSGHALVTGGPASNFEEGESLNSCGPCHSGEFFYRSILLGEMVPNDALAGVPQEEQIAITCAVCHAPHERTGNAVQPDAGRDFQLRFPEVASPFPENTISASMDSSRFNICGQCHHSRGNTWESSRGPHRSVQSNVYVGEMPMPDGQDPFVPSVISIHSFAVEQCSTCHLYRQDFMDAEAPAIAGHTFTVNFSGCVTSGCHPSADQAEVASTTLMTEMQTRIDDIVDRLNAAYGGPSGWEYENNGGPDDAGQAMLPDNVKRVRYIKAYVEADGSLGVHNPRYARSLLLHAEGLLDDEGI